VSIAGALVRSDLRRISRDGMLLFLAALPLLLAAVFRASRPALTAALDGRIGADVVGTIAAAVLLLLTPLMFGFIYGLMLLDERDDGVLAAIAVTPTGKVGFLLRRMLVPVVWTVAASLAVLGLAGLRFPAAVLAAAALLAALQTPIMALFVGAFAGSKVEGMALSKVGNVIITIGALGVLAPLPLRWAFAPSPHYWLVALLAAQGRATALHLAAGVTAHLLVIALLARRFTRRLG
jgi:fluoroquinolone transport system permease protein